MASPAAAVKKMARTTLTPLKPADPIAAAPVVGAPANLDAVLAAPVVAAANALPVVMPAAQPLIPAFLHRTAPNRGPGMHVIPTRNGMLDQVRAVIEGMEDAVATAHQKAIASVTDTLRERAALAQEQVDAGAVGAQALLNGYKQQLEEQAKARELEVTKTHEANELKFRELQDHVESLYDVLDLQTAFLRQVFTEEALTVLVERFVIAETKEEAATEIEPTVKRETEDF